ncbi:unnamed protein product [Effrenium voratum]|uniref:Uncharacterized protein n=1 Tax=Effrenium voratum TaxID=2562239 RepID=A0AA36J2I4_9DINO|nr:unnamed protein product [Effrenium voratum]
MGELPFSALVALIACMGPEPGERLLHLGSGNARAVGAWVLLVPRGIACGVERSAGLHKAALASVERLESEVQQRILLHQGDLFDMQSDWPQASSILLGSDALEEAVVEKVAAGLQRTQPGTRIAAIGKPLGDPGGHYGLELVRQVPYRTVGSGNTLLCTGRRDVKLAQKKGTEHLGELAGFAAVGSSKSEQIGTNRTGEMAPRVEASRRNPISSVLIFAAAWWVVEICSPTAIPRDVALVVAGEAEPDTDSFFTKVFAAAAQGCTAALVAAILSACAEPLVNRLLVKRMTVSQAYQEMNFNLVANFFLTTFPTNMLKFPVFEVINRAMMYTNLPPSVSGTISGWLFCTVMLPVTNYRFRKSMGWEIKASLLYQAYIPTVARDIIYGWARGLVGNWLQDSIAPTEFNHKAMVFGLTIWASCIISSPCNEWRGFTLQPKDKKLPFNIYFKPINYARSTGIGSSIMGVALMFGMMVTPYAEEAFGYMKEHVALGVAIGVVLVAGILAVMR